MHVPERSDAGNVGPNDLPRARVRAGPAVPVMFWHTKEVNVRSLFVPELVRSLSRRRAEYCPDAPCGHERDGHEKDQQDDGDQSHFAPLSATMRACLSGMQLTHPDNEKAAPANQGGQAD